MKVLVVSCSAWREDNNIGNTYSNLFSGMDDLEIAHICCGAGNPNTKLVKKHFHINEKTIIKNLINKKNKSGREIVNTDDNELAPIGGSKFFDFVRGHRLQLFFWARELIWCFKNWISDDLNNFVDDFAPDIIFAPFLDTMYLNDMLIYLNQYTKKPIVLYAWDDVYSLKRYSLSPLFWINVFIQRPKLRKVAKKASFMYTICDAQKNEYEKEFGVHSDILQKGYKFETNSSNISSINMPIKFVFTGIIGYGRWKTLAMIGRALKKINKDGVKALLYIYTKTPLNKRMRKELNIPNGIVFKGGVSSDEVVKVQEEADILVHAEAFDNKYKQWVRLSFSTKIVDYLHSRKCIFAVGAKGTGSIDYLIKNDAAIVATSQKEIDDKILDIIKNPKIIEDYKNKAWQCGRENHNIYNIQKRLSQRLNSIAYREFEEVKVESIAD